MYLPKKILTLCALVSLQLTILAAGGPIPSQDGAQSSAGNTGSVIYPSTFPDFVRRQSTHDEDEVVAIRSQLAAAALIKNVNKIIEIITNNDWVIKAEMGKHPLNEPRPYYFIEFLKISALFDYINDQRLEIFKAIMELGVEDTTFRAQVVLYFTSFRALGEEKPYFETIRKYWPDLFEPGGRFHNKLPRSAFELANSAKNKQTDSSSSSAASAANSAMNAPAVDNSIPTHSVQESVQAATIQSAASPVRQLQSNAPAHASSNPVDELVFAIIAGNFDDAKAFIQALSQSHLLSQKSGLNVTKTFIAYVYETLFEWNNRLTAEQREELFILILNHGKTHDQFKTKINTYFYDKHFSKKNIRKYRIIKSCLPDLFVEGSPLHTKLFPDAPELFENQPSSNAVPAASPALAAYNARVAQHQSTAAASSTIAPATTASGAMPSASSTVPPNWSVVVWPAHGTSAPVAPNASASSTPPSTPPILTTALLPQNVIPISRSMPATLPASNPALNQMQAMMQPRQSWASFFASKKGFLTVGVGVGILFIGWKLLSKKSESTQNSAAAKTK